MSFVIPANMVPVIISHNYGAGWATWNTDVDVNDLEIAQMILDGVPNSEIIEFAKVKYPDAFHEGLEFCHVELVEKGTKYIIREYDGFETLVTEDQIQWQIA